MKRLILTLVMVITVNAQALDQTHRDQALASLHLGAEYLLATQMEDGGWIATPRTAITALCVIALHDAPVADAAKRDAAIDRALDFIRSQAEEDGSFRSQPQRHYIFFSDAGYPTYTTAVALLAMATVQRPQDTTYMLQARDFLRAVQITDEGERYGGYGYKPGSRPDMSNTAWAAEAMYHSSYVEEDSAAVPEQDRAGTQLMWERLDAFLGEAQNTGEGKEADGGFGYRPGLASSGSMTYAGLKSMLYAQLDRHDPRVKAVIAYLKQHYTVQENPGQGTSGLYYYLQTISKALDLLETEELVLADGQIRNWRHDLTEQLAASQLDNGAWVNENGRYMENIEPLTTAYAMIALKKTLSPIVND